MTRAGGGHAARPRRIAVALGSNLGERRDHLRYAMERLRPSLAGMLVSDFIDTAPHGAAAAGQPRYLNGVVVGWSPRAPRDLLARLQEIEAARGRTRPYDNAPRTLDLDLILAGDLVVSAPGLTVPHPRFRERRFVLEPLAAVAPDLTDPVTGLTVRNLLARLVA